MAHLNDLEAEIGASEKEIFGNPGGGEPAVAAPSEEPTPDPNAQVTEPVVEQPVITDPVEPTTQEPVAAEPEGEAAKPAPEPDDQHDYKKRWINHKAASDATIHGLRSENVSLREEIQSLQEEVANLATKIREVTTSTDPLATLFTPEQEALIGKETLDAIKAAQKATADAQVKPLQDQLNKEREERKKQEAKNLKKDKLALHNEFLAKLEAAVPNYKKIDTNPNFLSWMKLVDPTSGQLRSTLFANAQRAGDVQRVAGFFLEFDELNKPKDRLAGKVTPTSAPAANASAPQTEQPSGITVQFIDQFYADVARGKYRGRLAKQQEIEQKIDDFLRSAGMDRR
jgi:uncharacterized protein YdcH (DUF465 family)